MRRAAERRFAEIVDLLPSGPGVYRFRDARGRALYIGRTTDLRRRVASYWGGLRDRRHLTRMVPRIAAIEAVACDSAHEAAWLERNLLERAKPYWNRIRGGLEVPVFLRLDPTRGLSVVHSGQRDSDFGPYLGGIKVRTAVSALDRVLPLAYAAPRLGGSERDLARVRGIDPDASAELLRTIRLVLDRDPRACSDTRAELARRRDTAAAELAFELAGRIQQEIEAVDWIVAPARVTCHAGDAAVHAWADGVLVSFQIKAGRMNRWTQRDVPAEDAAALVAATPAPWRDFASAAATLAARLRRGSRG